MKLKLFPWDNNIKPYWVNPENGYEWYEDKSTTQWCTRDMISDNPKLDAVCFYVVEVKDGERTPMTRVLIDIKTNELLAEEESLEAMATKIDMFRVVALFNKE